MVLKFFKKNSEQSSPEEVAASNLAKAASLSAVDRRAYTRIIYPPAGWDKALPMISYHGKPVTPVNIGLGGMSVDNSVVGPFDNIGSEYIFQFEWANSKQLVQQKARLLRIIGKIAHFKYMDLATDLIVRCTLAFKPGERGRKCGQLSEIPKTPPGIIKMWVNNYGDHVLHFSGDIWEVSYLNKKYKWEDGLIEIQSSKPVSPYLKDDLVLFLFNLQHPDKDLMLFIQKIVN